MRSIILVMLLLLAGCGREAFKPVHADKFAAVLTIKEPGITFIAPDGTILAEWAFNEPYTGSLLFDDKMLLYGTELTHATLYSVKTGKELAEWKVPKGVTGAAYVKETNEVALSVKEDGAVHFLNSEGRETKKTRTGHYPMNMLEYEGKLYIINYRDTVLSELDVHTHRITREFAIPTSSTGLAVNKEKNELWVGGHGVGARAGETIHVYSLETGSLTGTADAPVMPIAFASKSGFMYAASHGSNKLFAFDPERKLAAQTDAPANPFAIAVLGKTIFSAGYDSGTLSLYEEKTLQKRKTIDIGKGPFMIFVEEGE
ncbi:hypothetical protein L2D08_03830 [Domibacillus sp. PGB-M46]|uniref:hypothetical protein n=1 Tax=Domibacillus sp. PGB-M46 TaxID=2910255 RepID=UPI001F57A7ED|nr:hypothetical protein [Domibacillus sp. PGB-M46]MCI2253491.1 hypothetical protein [Domibacillus sp. PGB-M46]